MLEFFRDGGWPMFVILLFGFVSLASAAFFAIRPDGKHEGFLRWMERATMWAALTGVFADFGTVFHFTSHMTDPEERARTVLEGAQECMSPLVMGFAFLALTAFLAAIGRRRLDARKA